MRYAVIHDMVVENIIEWDGNSGYAPEPGRTLIEIRDVFVDIGYLYNGMHFINPEAE